MDLLPTLVGIAGGDDRAESLGQLDAQSLLPNFPVKPFETHLQNITGKATYALNTNNKLVGFAQWACENNRPENLRMQALTDPHSPGKYRINGLVGNMPEFEKAFACKAGQPMVHENRCRVW